MTPPEQIGLLRPRWIPAMRVAIGLFLISLLALGVALIIPDSPPVLAHEQTELVAASGAGQCPADVQDCAMTWTHVNSWTHYTATVPASCTIEVIEECGVTVTSTSAASSCQSSSNCGHGPHNSSPRPIGPGTWTEWNGHYNTNFRWSGQRRVAVEHEHGCPVGLVPGNMGICVRKCADGTYVVPSASCPQQGTPTPTPQSTPTASPEEPDPEPFLDPEDTDWTEFDPCANGNCPPPCSGTTTSGNCPEETPPPQPKTCTSVWDSKTRQELLSRLRWESVVPYDQGFTGHHHPEVPGGRLFLTAASTGANPGRHWIARQTGSTLNVVDAEENGCLWTATAVGVTLRELLPYSSTDLAKLRSPGNVAAAAEAQAAAGLWDRLSQQRKRWYRAAFPRINLVTSWCSPSELPPWTAPSAGVLALSANWKNRYDKCRWSIPRRGFWQWELQINYTSELGEHHTEVVAANLSWFREPTEYLGQQVTLW
ncbi:MAG: hypothetical protein OXF99_05320 [bacterium]|nr:hypothetical protein [bacterium]